MTYGTIDEMNAGIGKHNITTVNQQLVLMGFNFLWQQFNMKIVSIDSWGKRVGT